MPKYLIIFILLVKTLYATAQEKDTCVFTFTSERDLASLSRITNLTELIKANSGKEFYMAFISIKSDSSVIIKECFELSKDKAILFDGSVVNFRYSSLKVDTSILFNKVGNKSTVTYYAYQKSGGDYHAEGKVLILKLYEKQIIGYSVDGCNLFDTLKSISNTYFGFSDEAAKTSFFSLLNSLRN